MSSLRDVAEDYLRMRRALGYKLEIQGLLLGGFVSYLEEIDATTRVSVLPCKLTVSV